MPTNEIATQETKAMANPFDMQEGQGSTTLDSSDIQIPRLHLLQGLSEGVAEGDYKQGDILHTGAQEVLGGPKKPVEIIPFFVTKVSQKFRTDVTPKEYILTEPFANQPWEEENYEWEKNDGTKISCKINNFKTYIVYAIICEDDSGMGLPVSITFRSSAGKDGQKIASHFATVMQFNKLKSGTPNFQPQPPWNSVWQLTSELKKGKNEAYFKWVAKKSRKPTEMELSECAQWEVAIAAQAQKYVEAAGDTEFQQSPAPQQTTEAKVVEPQKPLKNHAPGAENPPQEEEEMDDIPF